MLVIAGCWVGLRYHDWFVLPWPSHELWGMSFERKGRFALCITTGPDTLSAAGGLAQGDLARVEDEVHILRLT